MLLSILIPGKNDNYRDNGTKTLELNLKQTLDNLKFLDVDDVEVVLCDWGSEKKIIDSIITEKHRNFKCAYVPPHIAKKYNKSANYSIVHPINTAFRKSTGKYVIFWDSDCFVTLENFKKLYFFVKQMDKSNDLNFYWGSKYHVPYEIYTEMNVDQLNYWINSKNLMMHDKISNNNFMGCGISILMNRSLWEESTGWYEELTYWGWQDIEFHNRLLTKYNFGGDLEDHGINFYHLNQKLNQSDHAKRNLYNKQINANNFKANSDNWGLAEEQIEVI
jgi:predicted glycosyltransferase involved in capsule biosynthesis